MKQALISRINLKLLVCYIVAMFSTTAFAQDYPTTGIVYNTSEENALIYDCKKAGEESIECHFTQTRMRKKLTDKEFAKTLEDARDDFKKNGLDTKEIGQSCNSITKLLDAVSGKTKDKESKKILANSMKESKFEVKEYTNVLETGAKACKTRKIEDFMKFIEASNDMDRRTCVASSYTYQQNFQLVQDYKRGPKVWAAKGAPSGPCGIIQASRFVPDKNGGSMFTHWKYVSQKIITNKDGNLFPGAACKDFDEKQYIFDWKSKKYRFVCDYIEFDAL